MYSWWAGYFILYTLWFCSNCKHWSVFTVLVFFLNFVFRILQIVLFALTANVGWLHLTKTNILLAVHVLLYFVLYFVFVNFCMSALTANVGWLCLTNTNSLLTELVFVYFYASFLFLFFIFVLLYFHINCKCWLTPPDKHKQFAYWAWQLYQVSHLFSTVPIICRTTKSSNVDKRLKPFFNK